MRRAQQDLRYAAYQDLGEKEGERERENGEEQRGKEGEREHVRQ